MTRERAKELLPVIQAFAEGKTLQESPKGENKWRDMTLDSDGHLFFYTLHYDYRIKPEPEEHWFVFDIVHCFWRSFSSYEDAQVFSKNPGINSRIFHATEII